MPLMPALQSSQKPLAELNPYPKQRRHRATDLGSFWKVWDNVWNKLKPFYFEGTQFWPIYFFCDPNGAGQRIFYHQRMHLKGSFGPEFNGCASPKTELSAGKPNGPHMFVAFLCQPSHRKTQGVDPDLWSLECWSCLDQNPKRPGPWVLPVVEQRIEQTQNERKMPSRYPQSKRNKTSGWSLSLVTSGHRPPPTRFPCLQI